MPSLPLQSSDRVPSYLSVLGHQRGPARGGVGERKEGEGTGGIIINNFNIISVCLRYIIIIIYNHRCIILYSNCGNWTKL